MTRYRIEPRPRFSDLAWYPGGVSTIENDTLRLCYVGSGKAGLDLIFSYLATKGTLPDKTTPILMARWLGTWVYFQAIPFGFPVIDPNTRAPVAVCYHQYGFPQDMDRVCGIAQDRGMVLIEDCAHAADSRYKGTPVGSFGQFAMFSFSKFVFCYALGAVVSRDERFYHFVEERLGRASAALRHLINGFKLLDEANSSRETPSLTQSFHGFRKMAYSRYGDQVTPGGGARRLWSRKRAREFALRREHYRMIRAEVDSFGMCDHLEIDDVSPYAVPLIFDQVGMRTLVETLRSEGIEAGLYQFDVARCVFEPDFRQCALVPVNSDMAGRGMEILLSSLRKVGRSRARASA